MLTVNEMYVTTHSSLFLEKENTSPPFTLKEQWEYPLTTQDIEISLDLAVSFYQFTVSYWLSIEINENQ